MISHLLTADFLIQLSGRASATSNYDDYPAPDFPSSSAPRNAASSRTSGRMSSDRERPPDSGYGGSISSRRPSEDRRRPSEIEFNLGRRSEDTFRRPDDPYPPRTGDDNLSAALASRRKPSQDITGRRSEDRERDFGRRPGQAPSIASDSTANIPPAQSTTAASAVIIPNKSTMEEEYIDIPYGREGRDSGVTTIDDRVGDGGRDTGNESEPPDTASDYPSPMTSRSPPAGLMGLSARLKEVEIEDDSAAGNRSGDELYDKYGRSSVDSTRSAGGGMGARLMRASTTAADEREKMRRDYEFKIATMQSQITSMQRDLDESAEHEKRRRESEARVRQLDEELAGLRQVSFLLS